MPTVNVAVPEESVVTDPILIRDQGSVKDTLTTDEADNPVMVKLRMALSGLRAKPPEYESAVSSLNCSMAKALLVEKA